MMSFQKGDIVVIPVPFTDNQTVKKRPAIVISNADVHATGDVVVVQITSRMRHDKLSFSLCTEDTTVALPKASVVRIHKIFVLESRLIEKKVSALKPSTYARLVEKIGRVIA
jgi:mRNA interferase MazF